MNRRSFIGTLTALAGLALAKIKAPVRPKYTPEQVVDNLVAHYSGDIRRIAGERLWTGDMVVFKENKIYRYPSKH
jgi:hypothetical protein